VLLDLCRLRSQPNIGELPVCTWIVNLGTKEHIVLYYSENAKLFEPASRSGRTALRRFMAYEDRLTCHTNGTVFHPKTSEMHATRSPLYTVITSVNEVVPAYPRIFIPIVCMSSLAGVALTATTDREGGYNVSPYAHIS